MSLYDKYHSDVNMNYMYNILSQIINKNIKVDISDNNEYKKIFMENAKTIFKEVNSDEITDINKVLLDKHIIEFTQKLQQSNVEDNVNIQDRYNDLIQSRNLPLVENNKNEEKDNPFKNIKSNILETITESPVSIKEEVIDNLEEDILPKYKISSNKRSNIQSSRFNYTYNLHKNDIKSSKFKFISKVVIPIEENYIFSSPILFLKIKELKLECSLELDHIMDENGKKYGYYKSLEDHEINCNTDLEKITIDIRDITETRYENTDIAKVNIIEIEEKDIVFTCTNVEDNYSVGEYVKIINNYTKDFKNNYPLKINKIIDNKIYCDYKSKVSKKITDVDMKLLNTSNQNIIYFN